MAGCSGSFSATRSGNIGSPIKTVAIGEFVGSDQGIAAMFRQAVESELSAAGFQIVTLGDNPDVIVNGATTYEKAKFWTQRESDWSLLAKTSSGKVLSQNKYHQGWVYIGWFSKSSDEIIKEFQTRLSNDLR